MISVSTANQVRSVSTSNPSMSNSSAAGNGPAGSTAAASLTWR